ncbi:neurturin [Orcinus orca]|uniref:Neurturin n=1 Tax=Tursiops truncatus TaxID=9739 RepID=A0A6J3R6T6_TURTR|nr:neurturin [Lagenorhynchus obliquidens]XP_030735262.1 neurturin [Globicephala melas]XP_030735263.1 neurturin [Globicephala melas]XP_033256774.1 neurturin [Orcinus orca]XP_033256775.1 neurturin [Orcinus orca]XP_033710466.1 neurturin [Tursiops truncatus]XP_033710467.1 neurturin [Tursiops truncatus]XP_049563584.1 neurturin [Orcinus orca]XP_049563586.1 neurturin [Orcinus orca]XP_059862530.1 neurturin [Delphinus delphis]XP_059862532.1 neurturin [Delphinus delphis]XP_060002707.1 neurturin [L
MQRWKAVALASVLCSSVLSIWMCWEGLLLSHRLGPALAPLRRPPRTLDARIARLAQYRALLQGAPDAVELRELTPWAGRSPGPRRRAGPRRRRARARSGTRPCGLRELEVRVSELGLGYASDETVLFRYCAGACEAATRVYDLGLRRLRQRRRVRRERVRAQPCCRPTAYEDEVSFLDTHSRYHTVHELSARECACV